VERAITTRTKGILPVHLYGQLADMSQLRAIANKHGLFVVEDSAHGVEIERDGVRPGDLGDAAVFSFYATKTMTSGDGGAIVTRSAKLAERLKRLRNHGVSRGAAERHGSQTYQHWDLIELGFKANLTDLDAAILRPQVPLIMERRDRRCAVATRYRKAFAERLPPSLLAPSPLGIGLLPDLRGDSSHHVFPIQVPADLRDPLLVKLGAAGIGTAVNFRAIHTLTYLVERLHLARGTLPIAEEIGDRTISLPIYPDLKESEQMFVIDSVVQSLGELLGRSHD
jgi:UDP-4-amino-4-deoxy-L-arabinose-oxoglutarate aminotransferase